MKSKRIFCPIRAEFEKESVLGRSRGLISIFSLLFSKESRQRLGQVFTSDRSCCGDRFDGKVEERENVTISSSFVDRNLFQIVSNLLNIENIVETDTRFPERTVFDQSRGEVEDSIEESCCRSFEEVTRSEASFLDGRTKR